jgi:hypothetical protein
LKKERKKGKTRRPSKQKKEKKKPPHPPLPCVATLDESVAEKRDSIRGYFPPLSSPDFFSSLLFLCFLHLRCLADEFRATRVRVLGFGWGFVVAVCDCSSPTTDLEGVTNSGALCLSELGFTLPLVTGPVTAVTGLTGPAR